MKDRSSCLFFISFLSWYSQRNNGIVDPIDVNIDLQPVRSYCNSYFIVIRTSLRGLDYKSALVGGL